jgi:pimeloyl-ACP methyl ester carboxylesterase
MVGQNRFTSSVVHVNGQRIHFAEAGEGPLVLLLHGFPESWYSWREQLRALQRAGYRAVAMSPRGYGRSSRPAGVSAYCVTHLVDDCVGLVGALGESRAVIVGHDWGAQVAWAAAWTRPDVFSAVAALGVPFGGRALSAAPGQSRDIAGEQRPSEVGASLAGPGLVYYRNYLSIPGIAEREMQPDVRGWLRDAYYSYSASAPSSDARAELYARDLDTAAVLAQIREGATCVALGARWRDRFSAAPEVLPEWLPCHVLDAYVREFEYTGFTGALNWYACQDLNWERLAPFAGTPIRVPALYVAGDRDPATAWSHEAVAHMTAMVPELRSVRISDCGHWIGEEQPEETNAALLDFLAHVAPAARSTPIAA